MTALIGALNKHGVAIAADSAATIGNGHYDKVYNTANKIFTLSKIHPVGIMICGNAEFKGVPWDIIIKSYRKNLGTKSFDNIPDYVQDFISYMKKDALSFGNFRIPNRAISQFVDNAINILINKVLPKPIGGKIQIPPMQSLCNAIQKEIMEIGFPNDCAEMFNNTRKLLGSQCANLVSQLYPEGVNSANIGVVQLFVEQFVFALFLRQTHSQLVFVGYGEKEIFPSITSVWIYSSINADWKEVMSGSQSISHQQNALICPFAQMEDMATLIEGIHPALELELHSEVGNTLNEFKQEILKGIQDSSIADAISKIDIGNFVNKFQQTCAIKKTQAYQDH